MEDQQDGLAACPQAWWREFDLQALQRKNSTKFWMVSSGIHIRAAAWTS